jgi:hypothetical protein
MKMKYHSILFAWILLIGCLGFNTACSNLEGVEDLEAIKEPLKSPENSRNAFDFVGVAHNLGLDHLGQFADSIVELIVVNNDQTAASQFTAQKLLAFYGGDYNLDSLGVQIDLSLGDQLSSQAQRDIIAALPLELKSKQYVFDLIDEIEAHSLETTKDVNQITDLILATENESLSDSTLTEQDRRSLLCGTSVLRHSLFFWNSLLYDNAAPWNRILDQIAGANKISAKLKKALCISLYDLVGVLVGAVDGPVGSIVVGAWASAYAAYHKLCG